MQQNFRANLALLIIVAFASAVSLSVGRLKAASAQTVAIQTPQPMFQTIFLKPGASQDLIFSSPGSDKQLGTGIATGDRTRYFVDAVNEVGEKSSGLQGLSAAESPDEKPTRELMTKHDIQCMAIRVSAAPNAEIGKTYLKIRALTFGRGEKVTTIKVVLYK